MAAPRFAVEGYCSLAELGADMWPVFCKFVSPGPKNPMNAQLDACDRKILALLQEDNTTPQRTTGGAGWTSVVARPHSRLQRRYDTKILIAIKNIWTNVLFASI
jgi:hypothetical protein